MSVDKKQITKMSMPDEQSENEMDEEESEHSEQDSEQLSHDESSESDNGHPFPTPPPDDIVAATTDLVMTKRLVKKTLLRWAEEAIKVLRSRSGSSAQAIMKYMKSVGYEITDERKTSKLLFRQLKRAAATGQFIQVKFSFKLPVVVKKPKSVKKMKEKKDKKKLAKKQETEPTEQEESEKPKKVKQQPKASKTTETAKKKKMADITAGAEGAKKKPTKQAKETAINKKKGDLALDALEMAKKTKKEKVKPPRVSIGILAHPSGKPKLQVKAIKKLTAGRADSKNAEDTDSEMDSNPNFTSTPVASEQKGKVRMRK